MSRRRRAARRRPRRRVARDGRRHREAPRRARAAVAVLGRLRRARCRVRGARGRGRHGRAGLDRDAVAHVPALGRTARVERRGRRGDRGPRGGTALRHVHRARAVRLRVAGHRAWRAPPRAHVAVRLAAPAPDQLRLVRCHALPRGRLGRGGDRREGPPHRHLPLVGCGRAAREQDGLGRAPHPPADRDRGQLPERAEPAPEQGQGHADPRGQAGRARPVPSARPNSRR